MYRDFGSEKNIIRVKIGGNYIKRTFRNMKEAKSFVIEKYGKRTNAEYEETNPQIPEREYEYCD